MFHNFQNNKKKDDVEEEEIEAQEASKWVSE